MIAMLGLDHQRATADVRGRLSFADERLGNALTKLKASVLIDEIAILSTCNRAELYVSTPDWLAAEAIIRHFLADAVRSQVALGAAYLSTYTADTIDTIDIIDTVVQPAYDISTPADLPDEIASALYTCEGQAAVNHLFRVAAGLQSMVVGEAQILGQVKDALTAAEDAHVVGEELRALFTGAIKVGKRVRAETALGRADVSVAGLAVRVALMAYGGLNGKHALLIGAGRTCQLCAQLLRAEGIGRLTLANRTSETAEALAHEVGAETITLDAIASALPTVDLLISATAAPYIILPAETVAQGRANTQAPLLIIDLAVPPDVEPSVAMLPGVTLYTIDSLRRLETTLPDGEEHSGGALNTQANELAHAERIVEEGLHEYTRSRMMRMAVPGIAGLRAHVDRSEQAERERALAQLPNLSEAERRVVTRFGERLVDKMFHHLVARIRSLAEYDEIPPEVTMRVLAQLFADPDSPRDE